MSFFFVSVVLFLVRSRCVFFSCHRIISHDRIYVEQKESIGCCCCCPDLYSVLANIRTGPTDANAFRGHKLTTQKGYTYRKEIKGPRKINTHAIIGKENTPPPRKIRLQTVRRRRRHDKGYRKSPSLPLDTRGQAEWNKQGESRITNQDNKITWFYPCIPTRPGCIHRRVCTGRGQILCQNKY